MDQDVARTKVIPALRRSDTLARPRLLDWLTLHTGRRLSLIVAEAGYGKTTLLADFSSRSPVTCLWFKVDEHEGDYVTFTSYVVAAIREVRPDFGAATLALLGQMLTTDPPRSLVIDTLIAEVAAIEGLRAIFVVDDFHLVDQTPDALEIMSRLIKEAPADMTFLVATRCPPDLKRGRLTAQGEAATLTTDDLRFSREETERLFRDVYGHPLEAEVVDQIDRRTEGWAASLQLLGSSIRRRSPVEVRELVRSLSGAEGPLYDFLAEEVLGDLTPDMRRFVIAASILERITPGYVTALLQTEAGGPDEATAMAWIEEADRMGLAGRHAEGSPHRFHPLLRDFLARQLAQTATPAEIRDAHRRVARRAEADAWLIACHHYLEAGDGDDAIRVLTRSLLVAAGTGDWGPASNLLGRMPEEPGDPAAQVILALQEMHEQRLLEALERLAAIPLRGLDPSVRAMVRYALMRGSWLSGDAGESFAMLRDMTSDSEGPSLLREMAEVQMALVAPGGRQRLTRHASGLRLLATRLRSEGLHYFLGVALHNSMLVAHSLGRYKEARDLGGEAIARFELSGGGLRERTETASFLATVEYELGNSQTAETYLETALDASDDPGALVGAADLLLSLGRTDDALAAFRRVLALGSRIPFSPSVHVDVQLLAKRLAFVGVELGDEAPASRLPLVGVSTGIRSLTLDAIAALVHEATDARERAREALAAAVSDGSEHWMARARIVDAAARGAGIDLRAALTDASKSGQLSIADVAEAVVLALDVVDPIPMELEHEIATRPNRWLPLLRRQLEGGLDSRSLAAARLISLFGTNEDVPRLRAWERTHIRRSHSPHLGRQLALRTSPKLLVHDLGGAVIERGERQIRLAGVRRRAAMLFMYLVARCGQPVLREQVLEEIWPDFSPSAAANSLNQTLYFVRRDIEPGYDEAVSVNYVLHEGDVIRLEPALVEVDSWRFQQQATSRQLREASVEESLALLATYSGPFAPLFAYEDWAIDWREQVHTSFLDLLTKTQQRLIQTGRTEDAVAITQRALTVDSKAIDLERSLVWLYRAAGSHSAAAEQYRHYAAAHREELGFEPPAFETLIDEGLTPPP